MVPKSEKPRTQPKSSDELKPTPPPKAGKQPRDEGKPIGTDALSQLGDRIAAEIPDKLAGRVAILIGLMLLLGSWIQRQFELSFTEFAGTFTAVAASYAFLGPTVNKAWSRHRASIETPILEALLVAVLFLLKTPVLTALFFVSLVPTLFTSSVRVVSAGAEGTRDVVLYPAETGVESEERRMLGGPDSIVGFNVFTTPLGRSFILRVQGYERRPITVFPGLGREVRVPDLKPVHTLMVRLPPDLLGGEVFGEQSALQLFLIEPDGTRGPLLTEMDTVGGYGGYVFGPLDVSIPKTTRDAWKNDVAFLNSGLSKDREFKLEVATYMWGRVSRSRPDDELLPGTTLECRYVDEPGGQELAVVRFSVTDEPFQDHMLETVTASTGHGPIVVVPPVAALAKDAPADTVELFCLPECGDCEPQTDCGHEPVSLGAQPFEAGYGSYLFAPSLTSKADDLFQDLEGSELLAAHPPRRQMMRSQIKKGFSSTLRRVKPPLFAVLRTASAEPAAATALRSGNVEYSRDGVLVQFEDSQ